MSPLSLYSATQKFPERAPRCLEKSNHHDTVALCESSYSLRCHAESNCGTPASSISTRFEMFVQRFHPSGRLLKAKSPITLILTESSSSISKAVTMLGL